MLLFPYIVKTIKYIGIILVLQKNPKINQTNKKVQANWIYDSKYFCSSIQGCSSDTTFQTSHLF